MELNIYKQIIKPEGLTADDYILVTNFNADSTKDFILKFNQLENKKEVKLIPIFINSYGGEVYSLLAMIDMIKLSKKVVVTIGVGKAMSCGSVLLAAGTSGYRYMSENCDMVIHEASALEWGKTTDFKNRADQLDRLNTKLAQLLAKFSKKSLDFYKKKLKEKANIDWYISAQEAKSLGLVDHIGVPKLIKE